MSETRTAEPGVHATAIIDPTATLAQDIAIGPFSVIGPGVTIGEGTWIGPHVVIERDTTLGRECRVHAGAVLGGDPQDLKYDDEPSVLIVGDRTVIRECVTLNRGSAASGRTVVGSDCLFMAYSHVAHDCTIGDHVVMANSVALAGHVVIEDWVIIGGLAAMHQFVRVGCHAIVGGMSPIRKDVPPYTKASGNPASLYGLNSVGLDRRGFDAETRGVLRRAYRILFQSPMNVTQAVEQARLDLPQTPEVEHLLRFIETSQRGIHT